MDQLDTEEFKNYVAAYLVVRDYKSLRSLFEETAEPDIAEVFSEIPIEDCISLYRLVPRVDRAKVFSYLNFERQEELLEELPDVVVKSILNRMEPDDRTKLLEDLPKEIRVFILALLDPEERKIARRLLSYGEDSVGRMMTPDFMAIRESMSVAKALEYIRWNSLIPVDNLSHLFVVDSNGQLVGEVGLAVLVLADPASIKINEIMDNPSAMLNPDEEQSEAVEAFRRYDRHFIPVVDKDSVLVGIVTADDVFDVAEEDATEDIQQFGGHGALEDSYFQTPVLSMLKKRAGWLAILFLGIMFTGTVLRHYHDALEQMIFLVFFLPLIVSSGGNSGTQAASLVLRGIAINEMNPSDWFKILRREIVIGLLLGSVLGTMGFIRAVTWGYDVNVGLVVGSSLISIVLLGTISGSMLPLLLKKTKLDPAVISSPFIATLLDITGTIIFINIAIFAMAYLGVLK